MDKHDPPDLLIAMINRLRETSPLVDEVDRAFGLDYFLSMSQWIEFAPLVIRKVLEVVQLVSGSQRGHMLSLVVMPTHTQMTDLLKKQGRPELVDQIGAAVRDGLPLYIHLLSDISCVTRYWAIFAILATQTPEGYSALTTHLGCESDSTNRDIIVRAFHMLRR